jgi:endonuclease/exonuclease/phosphatase family metal-dependent hydrolase
VEIQKYCKEDLEACSVRLYLQTGTISIVNLYRSPLGNFNHFLKELEILLNFVSKNSMRLIVCGDFNVNFNDDTPHRRALISLLATFGLYGTVDFPTRIHNKSIMTIDNIFVNSIKQNSINVYPWINGLSDHDAHFIVLHDIKIRTAKQKL